MSILSCVETILSVNDEQPQTIAGLEPIILEVIVYVFNTPEPGIGKYKNDNHNVSLLLNYKNNKLFLFKNFMKKP